MESQEPPLFNYMLFVKIRAAILKPWQVKHEINNKTGVTFLPNFCRLCVVKLDITLKPVNRFLYAAYHLKEEILGFLSMYKNNKSNGYYNFITHF